MKWLRFMHEGAVGFGTLEGDRVLRYDGELFDAPRATGETIAFTDVECLPPCIPGKIIGLWNNFRAAAEKNGWATPAEPLYFLESPGSATGHRQPIAVPASYDGRVAYEGELAVVIGRRARALTVADARSYIFGYSCANDVTALELLSRDPSFPQWTRAKSFDGFSPCGPVIATGLDPATLTIQTVLNGAERQNYPVSDMVFPPAALVSLLSRDMTLVPGDVICCGTSLGVGVMREPSNTVEVTIAGVGTLRITYRNE